MNSNVIANGDDAPTRNFTTTNETPLKKHERSCSSNFNTSMTMSLQEVASFGSLNYDFNVENSEDDAHQTSCVYQKTSIQLLDELLERPFIEPEEKANMDAYDKMLSEETHCILEKLLFDFSDLSPKELPGYYDSKMEGDDDDDFSGSDFSMFGTENSLCLTKKIRSRDAAAPQE